MSIGRRRRRRTHEQLMPCSRSSSCRTSRRRSPPAQNRLHGCLKTDGLYKRPVAVPRNQDLALMGPVVRHTHRTRRSRLPQHALHRIANVAAAVPHLYIFGLLDYNILTPSRPSLQLENTVILRMLEPPPGLMAQRLQALSGTKYKSTCVSARVLIRPPFHLVA